MVESLKKCPACESVFRPNAVFCHHCGLSLSIAELNTHTPETQNLSSANLPVEDKMPLAETPTVIKVTRKPVAKLEKPESANGAATKTDLTEEKIANSQSGTTSHKPVQSVTPRAKRYVSRTEYVWEESAAPNVRIILFSLLALLLIALLLWLNNFLR